MCWGAAPTRGSRPSKGVCSRQDRAVLVGVNGEVGGDLAVLALAVGWLLVGCRGPPVGQRGRGSGIGRSRRAWRLAVAVSRDGAGLQRVKIRLVGHRAQPHGRVSGRELAGPVAKPECCGVKSGGCRK